MEVLKVTFVDICVPSAQSLSRHKKLHNDLTKLGESARKLYGVKEWTIIRDIQLCQEKPTFDCVACNKTLYYPFVYLLV